MTEAWQSDWLVNDSKVACLWSGAGRSSQKSWLIPVAAAAWVRRGAYYHHRSNQGLRKLSRPSLPSSHPSRDFKYGGGEARSGVWGGEVWRIFFLFFEMVRSLLRNPLCCPFLLGGDWRRGFDCDRPSHAALECVTIWKCVRVSNPSGFYSKLWQSVSGNCMLLSSVRVLHGKV